MPFFPAPLRPARPHSLRPSKLSSPILPLALLALVGCTNGESSGEMTLEEFIAGHNRALCEFSARCSDHIHAVYPSEVGIGQAEGCADFMGGDPKLEAVFARGHTKIDAKAAERCFKATASCENDNELCDLALLGTLAQGAPCSSDFECSSGRCEGGSEASCGQCSAVSPLAKRGEPCAGFGCEQSGEAFVGCFRSGDAEPVCAAVRTVSLGGSCATEGDVCEEGAYCHPVDRTCRLPVAAGQPCTGSDRCARGSLCVNLGADRADRTCIAAILSAEGETCTEDFDLAADGRFHVCDLTRDLRCDGATRTCTSISRVGNGESCAGPTQCKEGLFCTEAGQCSPVLGVGQACSARPQCESQRCEGGVCVAAEIPVCQ